MQKVYNQYMQENKKTPGEIIKIYQKAMADQLEYNMPLPAYTEEKALLSCVRNGDINGLDAQIRKMAYERSLIGTMSTNPNMQAQFSVVSGLTLISRTAIAGGLSPAEAYHLSDAYLQMLNSRLTEREAYNIFLVAVVDFTDRVNKVRQIEHYSLPVNKAIRYIGSHLHIKLTLTEIAKHVGVTPQYLSSRFHKETGLSVMEYIRNEKLKVAARMLENSDYSISRISTLLEFPSQSAFTSFFRECYGITPARYRKELHG